MRLERRTWLDRLLNPNKADVLLSDVDQAAVQLDAAGMERKDLALVGEKAVSDTDATEKKPDEGEASAETPKPEDAEKDMATQVADKLAQQVFDAAQGDLASMTVEKLAAIMAEALRPVADGEEAAAGEDQTMEDSNKEHSGEVVVSVRAADANGEAVKAFTETFAQIVTDQGEMAKGMATQAQQMQELTAQVKNLSELVPQLLAQVQALDEQIKERMNNLPRSASAASETEIDPQSDAAKALEAAVKKGVNGKSSVLGIPVKA